MTTTERLQRLLTVEAAATPGPWENEFGELSVEGERLIVGGWGGPPEFGTEENHRLVVEARNNIRPLTQALLDVLELHQPEAPYGEADPERHCKGCGTHVSFTRWPCPTVKAITKHLGDNND